MKDSQPYDSEQDVDFMNTQGFVRKAGDYYLAATAFSKDALASFAV
jgi:hypothetical protein